MNTVDDSRVVTRTIDSNSVSYFGLDAWKAIVQRNEFDVNKPFIKEQMPYLLTYLIQTQNIKKLDDLLKTYNINKIILRDEYMALAEKMYLENPTSIRAENIYWKLRRYFSS